MKRKLKKIERYIKETKRERKKKWEIKRERKGEIEYIYGEKKKYPQTYLCKYTKKLKKARKIYIKNDGERYERDREGYRGGNWLLKGKIK